MTPRILFACTILAGSTVLTGCAQTESNIPAIPEVPTPVSGGPNSLPPYRVQVGDLLDVKLFLNPELNEEVVVRPDGLISTTLAQDIQAYNKTPAQISDELRTSYRSTLTNPQISVIVHTFAPNRVYVAGEVNSPGEFVTQGPNLTVSQAIARAGGVRLSAAQGGVFVIRRGENDQPEVFRVNYLDVISGKNPVGDVRLAQYDVVYVPRTGIYEAWTFWNQFAQQFIPMNWGFSYNINPVASTGK